MASMWSNANRTSESCDCWLHTSCVGIDHHSLPPVYICAFCAQTPNKRGPRVRDMTRGNNQGSGISPLAHKSFQSFRWNHISEKIYQTKSLIIWWSTAGKASDIRHLSANITTRANAADLGSFWEGRFRHTINDQASLGFSLNCFILIPISFMVGL